MHDDKKMEKNYKVCQKLFGEKNRDDQTTYNNASNNTSTNTSSQMSYDEAYEIWERDNYDLKLSQCCDVDRDLSRFVGYLFLIKLSSCLVDDVPEEFRKVCGVRKLLGIYDDAANDDDTIEDETVRDVGRNGCAINLLNDRPVELLDIALKTYGRALKHFDEKDKTYERCVAAVSQDGTSIVHVPILLMNLQLCKTAVVQNGICINDVIAFIPEHLRNEYYMMAVTSNPYAIQYVPDDCVTREMCEIAVMQRSNRSIKSYPKHCVIDFFPERYRTSEMYKKYLIQK